MSSVSILAKNKMKGKNKKLVKFTDQLNMEMLNFQRDCIESVTPLLSPLIRGEVFFSRSRKNKDKDLWSLLYGLPSLFLAILLY